MFELSSYDIKVDLVKELKEYLPTLTDLVHKIKSDKVKGRERHLDELYRLVETIRGACSLVKLDSLSKTASELQHLVEDIITKKLEMNSRVADAIEFTLDFLDGYTISENESESENLEVVSEVIARLNSIRLNKENTLDITPLLELSGSADEPEPDIASHDNTAELIIDEDVIYDAGLELEGEKVLSEHEFEIQPDDSQCFEDEFITGFRTETVDQSEIELKDQFDIEAADQPDTEAVDQFDIETVDQPDIEAVDQFEFEAVDYLETGEGDQFEVETPPSALSDDDGWEDIDLPQEELLEGFYQEAEEHFQNLGTALAELENIIEGPTILTPNLKELLRLIRRAVHTVKGAAAVIRLTDIAAWGHEFEDLLDWLYERAEQIDPTILRVVADSADILETSVLTPEKVDSEKQRQLRAEFSHIIGEKSEESIDQNDIIPAPVTWIPKKSPDENKMFQEDQSNAHSSKEPSFPVNVGKTLRVEIGKIEALVNLASELIIALSSFDENMNSLTTVISELDSSCSRLRGTSRDLESGYELKAIRNLSAYQHKVQRSKTLLDSDFTDFDLLELDRYSEFNLLIRSLNETTVDVNTISSQLSQIHRGFRSHFNRFRILLSDLQEKVMRVRMTPLASIVNRLRTTVRETAARLNKNVRLAVSGEEIELDKRIWETLSDPLMHLLRNAIDHGIEPSDMREAVNKPDLATIQLTAAYQGNQVFLRVIDDGAGLDFDAIRQRAADLDIEVNGKNDNELAQIIFHQGFSTRKNISEISGRGVGLDVVQENISALKGNVQIEKTEPGLGTSILIRIPLTLAVMRSLIFEVNGQFYATALYDIKEILRLHPRDLVESHNGKAVQIGEKTIPFYNLADSLPKRSHTFETNKPNERMLVIVTDTGTWQGVVAIDKMHTQKEIVVKNLGSHLHHVQGVAGATIMGDGKVIPILNLEELLRTGPVHYRQTSRIRPEVIKKPLEILVVDDSVSIRMVISRLVQRQGWGVQTAKDGVEAVELLHHYIPDLIVLDIEMPKMNGYEFMRMFRSKKKYAEIPVVMLTSRAAQKHRDKADNLGVNAFLVKPYKDSIFIDLIKKLTGLST